MRWVIGAVNSTTGAEAKVLIEASDERSALHTAKELGLYVSTLEPDAVPTLVEAVAEATQSKRRTDARKTGAGAWLMAAVAVTFCSATIVGFAVWQGNATERTQGEEIIRLATEATAESEAGRDEAADAKIGRIISVAEGKNWNDPALRTIVGQAKVVREQMRARVAALNAGNTRNVIGVAGATVPSPSLPQTYPTSATLSGSGWINFHTGTSEVLRGLKVSVLRTEIPRDKEVAALNVAVTTLTAVLSSTYQEEATKAEKEARVYRAKADADSEPRARSLTMRLVELAERRANTYNDLVKRHQDAARAFAQLVGEADPKAMILVRDLRAATWNVNAVINSGMAAHAGFNGSAFHQVDDVVWPEVEKKALVATTLTDIESRYHITDLRSGDYFVSARWSSGYQSADWLIPLSVSGGREIRLDLNNDTATKKEGLP